MESEQQNADKRAVGPYQRKGKPIGKGRWLMFRALPNPKWKPSRLPQVVKDVYDELPEVERRAASDVQMWREAREIKVKGEKVPNPVTTFEEAHYPDFMNDLLKDYIAEMNYSQPSPIQSQFWPAALQGRNVIAVSPTGTGKTLSYVLPLVLHVSQQHKLRRGDGPMAVILAPTRELVRQIKKLVRYFCQVLTVGSIVLYGGAAKNAEVTALRKGVEICISTPLRFLWYLQTRRTNMRRCTMLVLDEAEMMVLNQTRFISCLFTQLRVDCQMLLLGAHMSDEVKTLMDRVIKNPVEIIIKAQKHAVNDNIKQVVHILEEKDKYIKLTEILKESAAGKSFKTLIFANKEKIVDLSARMEGDEWKVKHLRASAHEKIRGWVIEDFRLGIIPILITTDVMAVGMDVPEVDLVINYDMPMYFGLYASRIGRTGRGDNPGTAHTFFTQGDSKHAEELMDVLNTCKEVIPPLLYKIVRSGKKPAPQHGKRKDNRYNM